MNSMSQLPSVDVRAFPAEYKNRNLDSALTSAMVLFAKLNEAGVRYGIFKSSRNTALGLAGDQDLDVLVAREDYHRFCAAASECMGMRSVNHHSLVSQGREDWFIPDFERAKYLHLDVHTNVRLGDKFNKRYPCYCYDDIRRWDVASHGGYLIPIVSPQDEATITLSRIAFRSRTGLGSRWQKLTGDWALEIDQLLFSEGEPSRDSVWHDCAAVGVRCLVRKHNMGVWVRREDMAKIRQLVRARAAAPGHAILTDAITNNVKACRYAASRLLGRLAPGRIIDRRRPAGGGLIVALVAPDGMGKSVQVDRLYTRLNWKFSCVRLYLGTGDGQGWWLRRKIRALYLARRDAVRSSGLHDPGLAGGSGNWRSKVGTFLLSVWGVLVALERHGRVMAARRMADRGFIVLCDRWPQSIQSGFMDGPTSERNPGHPTLLRRWELALYRRMSLVRPDIVAHLVGDYAVSQARKPGELSRGEFDRRIVLMEQMRSRGLGTHIVDASRSVDEVSKVLFELIWKAL
jgi:hypothetical protein